MDTLTHALSGALLARASCPKNPSPELSPARRSWIVFWAAAFPDSDFIVALIDPATYLTAHRGITHSVLMLPLWALLLAASFAWIYRHKGLAFKRDWPILAALCAMGIGIHIAFDVITAFGTQVLAPFSDWKAGINTTFIIDPWFSAIIVIGLVLAVWRRTAWPAQLAFVVLGAYIGWQALLHHKARQIAEHYRQQQQLAGYRIEVFPQPLSPLRWRLMLSDGEHYRWAWLSFGQTAPEMASGEASDKAGLIEQLAHSYQGPEQLQWQQANRWGRHSDTTEAIDPDRLAAWEDPAFEPFRRFARYPAWQASSQDARGHCQWFADLRFGLPGRQSSFTYGLCQRPKEKSRLERWPRGEPLSKPDRPS